MLEHAKNETVLITVIVAMLLVVSLLGTHGVAPERALLLSMCFGLTETAGCPPGARAWLVYSFAPVRRHPERGT
jgi:hypothetical protein